MTANEISLRRLALCTIALMTFLALERHATASEIIPITIVNRIGANVTVDAYAYQGRDEFGKDVYRTETICQFNSPGTCHQHVRTGLRMTITVQCGWLRPRVEWQGSSDYLRYHTLTVNGC